MDVFLAVLIAVVPFAAFWLTGRIGRRIQRRASHG